MRILLDECVPRKLGREITGHEVRTVVEMGWSGIENGALLQRAAAEFDILLTVDTNVEHQQNLAFLPLPVVVLHAVRNEIEALRPLMPEVIGLLSRALEKRIYLIALEID